MACLTVWPASKCGWNGKCVVKNETSFCECSQYFVQTLEFNLFVDKENIDSSICIYNDKVIDALYSFIIVVAILDTIVQLLSVTNRKKLNRRKYWFAYTVFVVSVSIYRLVNPSALALSDFKFTFFVTICMTVPQLQAYVLLNKYLLYMSKKVSSIDSNPTFFLRAEKARIGYFYTVLISVCLFQLIWISVFVERRNALILVRTMFGFQVFRVFYQIVYFYISLTELRNDMRKYLYMEKYELNSTSAANTTSRVTLNANLLNFIQQRIPQVKQMRNLIVIAATIELMFSVVAVSTDFGYVKLNNIY